MELDGARWSGVEVEGRSRQTAQHQINLIQVPPDVPNVGVYSIYPTGQSSCSERCNPAGGVGEKDFQRCIKKHD